VVDVPDTTYVVLVDGADGGVRLTAVVADVFGPRRGRVAEMRAGDAHATRMAMTTPMTSSPASAARHL
jgi:hypothetical protein